MFLLISCQKQLSNTGSFIKKDCNYDDTNKKYIKKDMQECTNIQLLCDPKTDYFKDECGCGCKTINKSLEAIKVYCTDDQRKAEVCPEIYHKVCGWFNSDIKCLKYPCADEYSNTCFACSDKKVYYWTDGSCPDE
jgi:hypothetical protein